MSLCWQFPFPILCGPHVCPKRTSNSQVPRKPFKKNCVYPKAIPKILSTFFIHYLKGYAICRRAHRQPVIRLEAGLSASARLPGLKGLAGCWAKTEFISDVCFGSVFVLCNVFLFITKSCDWEACYLHCGTLGIIFAPWEHPGGPREQQEGHVGSGIRFVMIL